VLLDAGLGVPQYFDNAWMNAWLDPVVLGVAGMVCAKVALAKT
jgi:hypothetical protein